MEALELHPVLAWVLAAAALATAGASLHRYVFSPLVRLGLDIRELLQDIRGTPARPGHPAVPGVLDQLASLDHRLEDHLEWSRNLAEQHLVEQERTRQEGHREASHLWDAVAEIARHGGLTIIRPPDARTRRTDNPEETP